jgi:hypothetical protein
VFHKSNAVGDEKLAKPPHMEAISVRWTRGARMERALASLILSMIQEEEAPSYIDGLPSYSAA